MASGEDRFRLRHDGALLELSARREGVRTRVELFRDGERVAAAAGAGKVLVPLSGDTGGGADAGAAVLALGVVPGTVQRALLLVPQRPLGGAAAGPDGAGRVRPALDLPALDPRAIEEVLDLPRSVRGAVGAATAQRRRFTPPPGTAAARLHAFESDHPRLWAARHVVLAVAKVVVGVLGLSAVVQLLLAPLVAWIIRGLRRVPWPDIDLPAIPWPAIPWPDLDLPPAPGWLLVLVGSAKFWGPVLVALGLAVLEVRRRRRSVDGTEEDRGAHR